MARLMTALMFVRPGDLYGKQVDFNVPAYALAIMQGHLRGHTPADGESQTARGLGSQG